MENELLEGGEQPSALDGVSVNGMSSGKRGAGEMMGDE